MCHRAGMGLPDDMEGPVRKKPRLSLSMKRKPQDVGAARAEDCGTGLAMPLPALQEESDDSVVVLASSSDMVGCESYDLTAESPPPPDPLVPPVASLHNLGNTCFMNSMLQILRFTPSFLPGLTALRNEITTLEDEMVKTEEDDSKINLDADTRRTWRVVRSIHSMYAEMDLREVQYRKMPTSDTSRMAVKPVSLLDSIRELNPMFEGNFQHDAQELLRCLLCYMEDAEAGLRKIKKEGDVAGVEGNVVAIEGLDEIQGPALQDEKETKVVSIEAKVENLKNNVGKKIDQKAAIGDGEGSKNKTADSEKDAPVKRKSVGRPRKQLKLKGGASVSKVASRKIAVVKGRGAADAVVGEEFGRSVVEAGTLDDDDVVRRDTQEGPAALRVTRGKKRRRSQTNSSGNQDVGGDCVDGGEVMAKDRTFGKNSAKAALHSGGLCMRKKGVDEAKKNGQTIVGFLKRIKDKLAPSSSREESVEGTGPAGVDEDATKKYLSSSQSSILSMLPFNPIRRMGMRGHVFNRIKASDKKDEERSDPLDDEQSVKEEESSVSSSRPGAGFKGIRDSNAEHQNGLGSPPTSTSATRHMPSPVSPSKRNLLSPTKSPHTVDPCDDITPALESDAAADIESTIDSVTRKYYSTLSRPSLNQSGAKTRNSSGAAGDTSKDLLFKETSSPCKKRSPPPSPHCPLTPGKDLIIHSPSKTEWELAKRQSHPCSIARQGSTSSAVKAMNFDDGPSCSTSVQTPLFLQVSTPISDIPSSSKLLPTRERQASESHSLSELRTSLLHLEGATKRTRASSSAPSSPQIRPAGDRVLAPFLSPSARAGLSSTAGSMSTCDKSERLAGVSVAESSANKSGVAMAKSASQLKVTLKRCDWLGVSPVKSVSASMALRGLQDNLLKARRNILCDMELENGSSKLKLAQETQNKSNKGASDIIGSPLASSIKNKSQCSSPSNSESKSETVLRTRRRRGGSYTVSASARRRQNRNKKGVEEPSAPTTSSQNIEAQPISLPCNSDHTSSRSQFSGLKDEQAVLPMDTDEPNTSKKLIFKSPQITSMIGLKLKPLSISMDKCDWMIPDKSLPSDSPSSGTSALGRRVMVNGKLKVRKPRSKAKAKQATFNVPSPGEIKIEPPSVKSEAESKLSFPLIEKLFGGTMMHLTRCLECERGRERKEAFLDISVAVKHFKEEGEGDSSEDEEGESGGLASSCLASLVRSSSSVERLRESNKYWCEDCLHHVEAERSCHYLEMPRVLSLHLKRFSAGSGLFGGVSKLNDKVDIPEELPCLRHQCADCCKDPRHRFHLFAIATHSGTSILHGHYRAYVKVQPWVSPGVYRNLILSQRSDNNSSSSLTDGGGDGTTVAQQTCPSPVSASLPRTQSTILPQSQPFKPSDNLFELHSGDVASMTSVLDKCHGTPTEDMESLWDEKRRPGSPSLPASSGDWPVGDLLGKVGSRLSLRAADTRSGGDASQPFAAGGVRGGGDAACSKGVDGSSYSSTKNSRASSVSCTKARPLSNIKTESEYTEIHSEFMSGTVKKEVLPQDGDGVAVDISGGPACFWLECDDECVRVMEEEEFGQKLREEDGALLGTPYVLFYHSYGIAPA